TPLTCGRCGGGGKLGTPAGPLQKVKELVSSVTAPLIAKALPEIPAPVFKVMLVSAMMLPANAVPVPKVAELPTCQNTPQLDALLINLTEELLAVVRVLPIWNTNTAFGSPWASSVSIPVNWAEVAKQ